MVATFLGPVYVDWPMLQSNSPESRDFIRLEVGPSLVCLAIGKIYGRFSVPPILELFYKSNLISSEGADSIDFLADWYRQPIALLGPTGIA